MLERILVGATVRALRPDFAVLLMTAEALEPYPLERRTAAGAGLAALLRAITPSVLIETRLVAS
jgi:hypothetical protein